MAGFVLSSVGVTSHLFEHYQTTCPREANENDAFIYPLDNHGSIVLPELGGAPQNADSHGLYVWFCAWHVRFRVLAKSRAPFESLQRLSEKPS
jgi:hypothetical protein